MNIQKVEINNRQLLDIIQAPLAYSKIGFPLHYEVDNLCFDELYKGLTENCLILTYLAKLYFRSSNAEVYGNSISNFVLSKTEFEKNKGLLHALFNHIVASDLFTTLTQEELMFISLRGITPTGEEILAKLLAENKIPYELKELYINKKVSDDATLGLYRITDCYQAYESDFLQELINNKYNNSLDISALTLSECMNNEICNYIALNKKDVYIYVTSAYNSRFNTKHLIWH